MKKITISLTDKEYEAIKKEVARIKRVAPTAKMTISKYIHDKLYA